MGVGGSVCGGRWVGAAGAVCSALLAAGGGRGLCCGAAGTGARRPWGAEHAKRAMMKFTMMAICMVNPMVNFITARLP